MMCENPDRKVVLLHHHPDFRKDHEQHQFALGQVVTLSTGDDYGFRFGHIARTPEGKEVVLGIRGFIKLIVVGYTRDCDGEPLYILSDHPIGYDCQHPNNMLQYLSYKRWVGLFINNVSKRSLIACEGEIVPLEHENIFDYEDGMRRAVDEFHEKRAAGP